MNAMTHERDGAASWLKETRHDAPFLPIEKMPQLNASLERFSETLGSSLTGVCGPGSAGTSEHISTSTTSELFVAYRGHAAAVLRSRALNAVALMIFGDETVSALLNSIFGIEPSAEPAGPEDGAPRERTALENELIAGIARILAVSLQDAFAPVASLDLAVESLANSLDESLLGSREMAAIVAQFSVKTRGGPFSFLVALPQTLTGPLGDMFARGPDPDAANVDPHWTRLMEQGVTRAKLTLTAILDEFKLSLGEVSQLAVGVTLPLSNAGDGHVRIECAERGIFLCRLGERGDRYALEIDDILAPSSELQSFE